MHEFFISSRNYNYAILQNISFLFVFIAKSKSIKYNDFITVLRDAL